MKMEFLQYKFHIMKMEHRKELKKASLANKTICKYFL